MAGNSEKKLPSLAERARKATESADDLFAEAKGVWAGALDNSTDPNKALIYALRGHALELSACTCILAAVTTVEPSSPTRRSGFHLTHASAD